MPEFCDFVTWCRPYLLPVLQSPISSAHAQAHQAADLSSRALYGSHRYDNVEEYEDEDDEEAL